MGFFNVRLLLIAATSCTGFNFACFVCLFLSCFVCDLFLFFFFVSVLLTLILNQAAITVLKLV